MQVIDHRPQVWFLLRDGERLYLDQHCSHGFADYPFTLALSDAEARAWRDQGSAAIDRMARDIQDGGAARIDSTSPYGPRNLTRRGGGQVESVHRAIMAWVAVNRPPV